MIRHDRDPVLDSLPSVRAPPTSSGKRPASTQPDHLTHVPVSMKPGQLQRDLKLYARRQHPSSCHLDQGHLKEAHRIHMSLKCRLALSRPDNRRLAFPTLCANIYSAQKPFLCFHPISDACDLVVVCCL